jgi:hypothetical protein
MPHLIETITDKKEIKRKLDIFCKGEFTEEEIERAERLDIMGSSFSDPGEDWCEYRLIFSEEEVKAKRVAGY